MDKREIRFWQLVDKRAGENSCWLWQGTKTKGLYGQVNYKGKRTTAHRIAFELSGQIIKKGEIVMHACDNPPCCNPKHLRAGTQKENIDDMLEKNRGFSFPVYKGESHGMAKVSDEIIRIIRVEYAETAISQISLGGKYGLSQTQISRIIRNTSRCMV